MVRQASLAAKAADDLGGAAADAVPTPEVLHAARSQFHARFHALLRQFLVRTCEHGRGLVSVEHDTNPSQEIYREGGQRGQHVI